MFEAYDPTQLKKLDDMMSIASGREDQILAALVKRYGPEPPAAPVNTSPSAPVERAAAVPKVLDVTPTDDGEPLSYETRFRRIFEHYDTSQLPKLPELMRMSKGREEVLLNSLVKRYGPEPKSQEVSGQRDEAKPKDIASTNSVAAFDNGQPLHPPLVQLASADSNVMPLSASSAAGGTSPTFDQSRDRWQSVSTTYDDPPSATRIGNGQQDQRSSSVISDPFDIDVNTSPTVSVAQVESPLGQPTYVVNVPSTTFDDPFSEDYSRGNVNDVTETRRGDQHEGRQSLERGNHYERAQSDRSEASQHPRAVPRAVQHEEPSHRNTPQSQTRSRDAANTKPPQWEEYWDDSVASARDIEEDLRSVARTTSSHYDDSSPTHGYDRRGPDAPYRYNDKQPHRHSLEVAHSAPAATAPPPAFWGSEMAYMLSELRLLREQVTLQAKDIKLKDEELYQLRATVVGLRTALEVMQRPSGPIPLSTMSASAPAKNPVVRSSSSIREASFDPFEDSPPRRPSLDASRRVESFYSSPDAQLRQPSASAVSTHVSRGSVLTPYVTAAAASQPTPQTAQQLPAIGSNRSSPRRYENTEPSPPPSARSNVSFRQPVDDSAGPHLENPLRGISSAKLQSSMSPVRRFRQHLHSIDAPLARGAIPVRYSSHKDASVFPTSDGVPQEYLPHSPLATTALGSYYQPQDSSPMSQLLW
ncbi:Hypothetical protein, putative [Bodo saltans]|uniref:Uncharacterized protein n=1 Tax=Bodo saltans TaxID=75058 RepID=A0A0S4KG25_BODSA|nr:Hypothetical protein, putative [Bodo saltans]|eukprot:CUI14615.1 Hypothetical protein, putative [Bodo saltans]